MSKAKRLLKATKKESSEQGIPLCPVMAVCNQVVVGDDKVATLVRLVDTVGLSPTEHRTIGEPAEFAGLTLFMAIRRGDSSGKFSLVLSVIDPSGKRTVSGTVNYEALGGPESGTSVTGPLRIVWEGAGLYWIELSTQKKKLIARMPLRLLIGNPDEIKKKIADRDLAATPKARKSQK